MTAPFVPAYLCDQASHYLLWECLVGRRYGWMIRHGEQVVGRLDGFPVGAPARTYLDAVPWAAALTGIPADQWIQQPRRSGAHHTHLGGEPCTRSAPTSPSAPSTTCPTSRAN